MTRPILYATTLILAAAVVICWSGAEWSIREMYAAGSMFPAVWLLVFGPAAICCVLFFAAFVANVVDLLEPVWGEQVKTKR